MGLPTRQGVVLLLLIVTFSTFLTTYKLCSFSSIVPADVGNQSNYIVQEQSGQNGASFTYRVSVYVQSVSYAHKNASLLIQVEIFNCNFSNASEITLIFEQDANYFIECPLFGTATYLGIKTIDSWPLVGKGELYPFDTEYMLHFAVSQQFYLTIGGENQLFIPNATLDSNYSPSNFRTLVLRNEFYIDEFEIFVQRDTTIPFYELLLPIILCYLVLGGSIMVRRSDLNSRLTIYMSLFIFSPTFLFAIQSYLPSREFLCIPEILLVSQLVSNAIFLFFSTVRLGIRRTWIFDLTAVVISMVTLAYLYSRIISLEASFPVVATLFLTEASLVLGSFVNLIRYVRRTKLSESKSSSRLTDYVD